MNNKKIEYKNYMCGNLTGESPFHIHGVLGQECFIAGWASVCNVVDCQNDLITSKALNSAIKIWKDREDTPIMLMEHNIDNPVGVWQKLSFSDKGLYVEGKILSTLPASTLANTLLAVNKLQGLSIGYVSTNTYMNGDVRVIDALEIYEISLVSLPANPQALITEYEI